MNKTKGFLRIGIVLSVLWVIYQFDKYRLWEVGGIDIYLGDFIVKGIVPLVVFWGLVWVIAGFRNKDDETEDAEDDNQDK